jgi:hypothetical protein
MHELYVMSMLAAYMTILLLAVFIASFANSYLVGYTRWESMVSCTHANGMLQLKDSPPARMQMACCS